jgi:hypothetical protein
MAETVTRQLREPFVEAAGLGITNEGLRLLKDKIDTSQFTGRQFVAPMSALETQAQTAAANLQAGPDAYQDYMSPYQREVIDATTAALDREQQKGVAALRQRAIQAGAFGGAREGAMLGEYQAAGDIQRALAEAQLRQQGFQQAQQAAISGLQAQQGLGQYQSALGGQQRGLEQALRTADATAAREAAFTDFTRLGLIGPQLSSVIGGFPAATQVQTSTPPSAMQQALGLGIGGIGLAGAVKGLINA